MCVFVGQLLRGGSGLSQVEEYVPGLDMCNDHLKIDFYIAIAILFSVLFSSLLSRLHGLPHITFDMGQVSFDPSDHLKRGVSVFLEWSFAV